MTSYSQTGTGTTYNLDVLGEGAREISLTKKHSDLPATYDTLIPMPPIQYEFVPKTIATEFDPQPIKPARLKMVEPLEKLYRGYVKGGVGNYTTPLLDVYYGSERSRDNNWGINYKHLSSQGGINGVGFDGYSENEFHANYKHFLKNHSLRFAADYERDVAHFLRV